jgi:hypothetical protein
VFIGLYLLYTSQNLLGTIFRVTFTMFYRRIWNIVGKYSILCYDTIHFVRHMLILSIHIAINLDSQHYPKLQSLEFDLTEIPGSLGRPPLRRFTPPRMSSKLQWRLQF